MRACPSVLAPPAPRPPNRRGRGCVASAALVLAGLLALGPARAQAPPPAGAPLVRERWTVREGLPVNHVNTLHQTPDGYLWLATYDGLVRFDGVRFVVFNVANTPGLPSNRIGRLFAGTGADFWLSTEQGHLVRVEGGRFTLLGTLPGAVNGVVPGGGDVAWVATSAGLYRYGGGRLAPFAAGTLGDANVATVLVEPSGALWAATLEGRLWRFHGGRARVYSRSDHGLARLHALHRDADGALWVGGDGVARFARGRWETFAPDGARWARPGRDYNDYVYRFYRAPGGPLWIVTMRGLSRWDGDAASGVGRLTWLDAPLLSPFSNDFATCPDGTTWMVADDALFREGQRAATVGSPVYDLHCDREGSVWAATQTDGLHRFRPGAVRAVGPPEGLGLRNVYGVSEDRSGGLWFTGQDGVVSRLHGGRFRHLTAGAPFVPTTAQAVSNQAVYEDRAGDVWLGFQVCRAADRTPDGGCERFARAPGRQRGRPGTRARRRRPGPRRRPGSGRYACRRGRAAHRR